MPAHPQEPTGRRLATRLSLFYAALFFVLGVHVPFLPVWLSGRGLDAQTIGFVLASPIILRLVVIPLVTRTADRHDALREVIVCAAATALLGFAVLGFAGGTLAIAVLYTLATGALMPLFVLSDVYALRGLSSHRRAYGPVRLWGSVAFVVATLGAGFLLDVIAARDLIWLVAGAMAACAMASLGLPPVHLRPIEPPNQPSPPRLLFRSPAFLAVTAAASLIQGSHALYYGFSTIEWQTAGFTGGSIGALWALGVLAEIVLFAVSARLPRAFGPSVLILIGGAGALARWLAMALAPAGAVLPLLQCLHGLSFGATHLGTLAYIARAAPPALAATAQGLLSVMMGLVMAAATGLSGLLYGHFGAAAYAAMALLAGAGILAALAAHQLLHAGEQARP